MQSEDVRKVTLESNIAELEESIEMTDRDREMIKSVSVKHMYINRIVNRSN